MPNILVRAPKGVFDPDTRERLAPSLTNAAPIAEQAGDAPVHGLLTRVEIEEFDPQALYLGGRQVFEDEIHEAAREHLSPQ